MPFSANYASLVAGHSCPCYTLVVSLGLKLFIAGVLLLAIFSYWMDKKHPFPPAMRNGIQALTRKTPNPS